MAESSEPDDDALFGFFRAIAEHESFDVARMIDASPRLATTAIRTAASRQDAETYFLDVIRHYVYAGDTALHIAAASYQRATAEQLVAQGAPVRHRNRRGAEPLHYAVDGVPSGAYWDPHAQRAVIEYLIEVGADPNARDVSGVAVLHRAVRTRCSEAVRALLEHGAEPLIANTRGSTPLHLAVQNTGRSSSGTDAARAEQRRIIELLLHYGAAPTDQDAQGKTVAATASSAWIRDLLR
jgi:ankyrin repeat protein